MDIAAGKYWDEMWSPAAGCDPSMPCAPRCWASTLARRLAHNPSVPPDVRYRLIEAVDRRGWTGHTVQLADWLDKPARTKRPTVFATCWLGDLYRCEARTIEAVYRVMHEHPRHTYLILTKLPSVMAAWSRRLTSGPAYGSIWHGVSVMRQDQLVSAINNLYRTSGRLWISLGPWLGGFDGDTGLVDVLLQASGVEQVVMEGLKGSGSNDLDTETVLAARQMCEAARHDNGTEVKFFFKGFGDSRGRSVWTDRSRHVSFDELAWATPGDTETDGEVA
jgi:protein gp37